MISSLPLTEPLAVSANRIHRWYKKSGIDYAEYFIYVYIAYNTWYTLATGKTNDREAINQLKRRAIIWNDYCDGKVMQGVSGHLNYAAELTQREPLIQGSPYWNGEISSSKDWTSLIEYWYQVRCLIIHGAKVKKIHTLIAYATLNIFMAEIVKRINESSLNASNIWQVDMHTVDDFNA